MSYESEVLADTPLLYWRLGESIGATTAVDISGFGNDGTYRGNPELELAGFVVGDPDTACGFDQSDHDEDCVSGAVFVPGTLGAFTLECIAVINTELGGGQLLTVADPTGAAPDLINVWFFGFGQPLNFDFQGLGVFSPTCGTTITGSAVHHIVATYDGSELRLYIDGALAATEAFVNAGAHLTANCAFAVCDYPLLGGGTLTANVDEVAFYDDRALSALRVAAHYAAMIDDPTPPPPPPAGGECFTLASPIVADGITPDGDGIVYTVQAISGWFDGAPIRFATMPIQPIGEQPTVWRENARQIMLTLVAHAPGVSDALGDVLCFTAMQNIVAAFNATYVPVSLRLVDAVNDVTRLVRLSAPIRPRILGNLAAVSFQIPLFAPDPT